jgi:signal transduction histidine kinase
MRLPRLRSPLVVRIYLIGIAQMIFVGLGFFVMHRVYAARMGMEPHGPSSMLSLSIIAFILIVVGVSSWLLARTLTRPLRRLSRAANEFGAGHLESRAALGQRDELGDVSRAFDEMADRVAALLRAERELLANVSHELRTPLARIRMAFALASEGNADVARASFADISEDIDELERLVADILTTARLDLGNASAAGVPPLRSERVAPADLLAHAAGRFRGAHPERALVVDVAGDLPSIDCDPVLVRRVVDNLLENAHAYSDSTDDPVDLLARTEASGRGDGIAIDVVDRGIGMSADDLRHAFKPFFRADRSRTRATGGLGLGLTLAKRIVDAHGGTLELTSVPNEGTRARIWLPAARTPSEHR